MNILDFIIETATGTPAAIALVGAHFLPFSLVSWAVLLVRIVRGRFRKGEWILLGIFLIAIFTQAAQLFADRKDFFDTDTWGMPRYFGVYAPLLWIWGACGLAEMWSAAKKPWLKWPLRAVLALALGWVLVSQNILAIADVYRIGAFPDVKIASKKIAEVIKADYAGPERQAKPRRVMGEYYTSRRPVVFSDFAAAAWEVRGQSEGAIQSTGACPYPDDYLFIRVGSGYGNISEVNSKVYDYVGSVRGQKELGTIWRLFRRKTTPHN